MTLRNVAAMAAATLLFGCPSEKPPEKMPVVGAKKVAPLTTPAPKPTPAPPKKVVAIPACAAGPKWIGKPPCIKDGMIYAESEAPYGGASSVKAAQKARRRLALAMGAHLNDQVTLKGSEVVEVHHCDKKTHALARIKPEGQTELRTCAPDQLTPAAPSEGCPPWTKKMAWQDGDTYYGVSPMYQVLKKFQREQSAVNAARANVWDLMEVKLQLKGDDFSVEQTKASLNELRRSPVTCSGGSFLQVAFKKGAEGTGLGTIRGGGRKIPDVTQKSR